jgi:uncharacterized protein (TIGR02099 family)
LSSIPNAPVAALPRIERRRRRGLRLAWRLAFGLLFAAWSLLLLAWLTLQWGIVPRVGQWKPQIEARASAALGVPVTIGAIRVESSGWMPLIELDHVVLAPRRTSSTSGPALVLPKVHAALSARSLLGLELRFEQLHVDGAELEVRRDTEGRVFVGGIEVRAGTATDDREASGTEWLLAQREIAVRNGRLRWIDEQQPQAAPLELTGVDAVLRNRLAQHQMRLDATPPAGTGARFTLQGDFRQPFLAQRSDWRRWSGTAYVELPHTDAAGLRRALPQLGGLPFEVESGTGALRAWIDVRDGQPHAALADLALRDVALRFAGRDTVLSLQHLSGRVSAQREGQRLRLGAERLAFRSGETDWPASQWAIALDEVRSLAAQTDAAAAPIFGGGEFSADRLDIAALARLAAQLPIGQAAERLLTELAPSGQVRGLNARWEGPLDAPRRYQVKAQADGLAIAAAPASSASAPHALGRPGFRNATLDIDASESGGRARLTLDKGTLNFPGVFDRPEIALDHFESRLTWRIAPAVGTAASAIELGLADTRFANADLQGELSHASWRTGNGAARFPGQLDLAGTLSRGRAAAVARYLPLGLPDSVRQYVDRAVGEGSVAAVNFKVRGDLSEFPFTRPATVAAAGRKGVSGDGEFRIAARVEDVSFAYVPGTEAQPDSAWPAFSRVTGELVFDRASMEIRNARARLWGLELTGINGAIKDLGQAVLRIDGQARGPAADLLRYLNGTPLAEWTGDALRDASAGGPAELRLALDMPLDALDRSTVQGSVVLPGNDVRVAAATPLLANAKARIAFTQQGFTVAGGSARVLGGDATFDGGLQPDGSLRFNGQGVLTADGLRRATELGAATRAAAALSGQTPYRLQLGVVRGRTEFTLTSPLTGLAMDLPAPLRKSAEVAWPLRVETRIAADGPLRDTLRVELGSVLSALYQRDLSRDGAAPVLRGAIGVAQPAPSLPERGVQAVAALGAVDADDWQAALDRVGLASGDAAVATEDGYLPRTLALRAQSLVSGGRRLTNLVAGVSQDLADGTWRGSLDADQLGGYVEYRAARGTANPGRIYARLARLALPPGDTASVEDLLADAPATVPALDIVIDNFELRGKRLGRLELEAVNRGGARTDREWRLTRLALANPEAQLTGSGQWQPQAGAQRMVLDFKLELTDSGAFLERLGFAGTLRGGKGRLTGQLSWAGSPLAFHVPSLDGKLDLQLDAGQFLKAGPGAGRLLSVLSLQSLPRRLVLDFRDLFQEGFAFDNVSGDVTIDDGVAATRNLRMRGVQAAVLMEGQADLQRETQDLRVVVVPEINAGTASLAYAVINPAVGLGSFLAQMFLRRPLMAAGTREFSVQGTWADPKVERVERKLGEPLPSALDLPSAAASAPKGP